MTDYGLRICLIDPPGTPVPWSRLEIDYPRRGKSRVDLYPLEKRFFDDPELIVAELDRLDCAHLQTYEAPTLQWIALAHDRPGDVYIHWEGSSHRIEGGTGSPANPVALL